MQQRHHVTVSNMLWSANCHLMSACFQSDGEDCHFVALTLPDQGYTLIRQCQCYKMTVFSVTLKACWHEMAVCGSQHITDCHVMPLLLRDCAVYMDNWYSSCRLYQYHPHRPKMACNTLGSSTVPLPVQQPTPADGHIAAFCSNALLCLVQSQ